MNKISFLFILSLVLLLVSCIKEKNITIEPSGGGIMKLSSPAFENNRNIPSEYTCDGDDVSPELDIADIPEGTRTLALIVDDPDAPSGTWDHWIVYNIPVTDRISKDSVPGTEGTNSFRRTSYGGPCPPSGTHRYFFKLYALDIELDLTQGASKKELENAMQGHILDTAEFIGKYSKKS